MSRRVQVEGMCRICGTAGPLTFDHVPPKRCFNNFPGYYEASVDTLFALDKAGQFPDMNTVVAQRKARKWQGGIGFNSLCGSCNNNTGSWYGNAFAEWVHQSMGILLKANGQPSLIYPTFFFPLRVIKQIITMFLSIDDGHLQTDYPALPKFILNREERFLDKAYKIYAYYNFEGSPRYLPRTFMTNGKSTEMIIMSEISFPPFGFVLSLKGPKPAPEITDISHFTRFNYGEWTDFYQRFPVLPTHLPNIPVDYRTRLEIEEAIRSSRQERIRRGQM
ncbi:MAG: hypothetical protein K8H89_06355 [Flavobacteriales bacterium]|nr:hypothetical protein [Flavobacteriales bacterium]